MLSVFKFNLDAKPLHIQLLYTAYSDDNETFIRMDSFYDFSPLSTTLIQLP